MVTSHARPFLPIAQGQELGYEAVAENRLRTKAFACPAVSRDQLFLRVADTMNGIRKESLCLSMKCLCLEQSHIGVAVISTHFPVHFGCLSRYTRLEPL
jgi:hypothetical protein